MTDAMGGQLTARRNTDPDSARDHRRAPARLSRSRASARRAVKAGSCCRVADGYPKVCLVIASVVQRGDHWVPLDPATEPSQSWPREAHLKRLDLDGDL
jgi:hypothetical protein